MLSPEITVSESLHLSEHEEQEDEQAEPPIRINPSSLSRLTNSITTRIGTPVVSAIFNAETVLFEVRYSLITK